MKNLYNMGIPAAPEATIDITRLSSNAIRTMQLGKVELADIVDEVIDVVITTDVAVPVEDGVESVVVVDFSELKVVELKAILDANGVVYTATRKDELVALVKSL